MTSPSSTDRLTASREHIAATVRRLRRGRSLTQGALAHQLGLSQSRLSELERGQGSFTAEQLLELLRIFNVDLSTFVATPPPPDAALQNALLRFGAHHLRPLPDASASSRYPTPADAVKAVLLSPTSERFLTALAPVLVEHCDAISLPALQADLVAAGRPARLPWLAENTRRALAVLDADTPATASVRQARRAALVLDEFLAHLPAAGTGHRDALDPGTRSPESLGLLWDRGSAPSQRWRVVSAIQVDDFAEALRSAREHG